MEEETALVIAVFTGDGEGYAGGGEGREWNGEGHV